MAGWAWLILLIITITAAPPPLPHLPALPVSKPPALTVHALHPVAAWPLCHLLHTPEALLAADDARARTAAELQMHGRGAPAQSVKVGGVPGWRVGVPCAKGHLEWAVLGSWGPRATPPPSWLPHVSLSGLRALPRCANSPTHPSLPSRPRSCIAVSALSCCQALDGQGQVRHCRRLLYALLSLPPPDPELGPRSGGVRLGFYAPEFGEALR